MEAISFDQSTFLLVRVHLEQHYFNPQNNFMGKKNLNNPLSFFSIRFFHKVDWASCSIAWIGLGF
jgi:hypothetical protein